MTLLLPEGSWPVLFTPFTEDLKVDYGALNALLEFYHSADQAGIFAIALSGEVFELTSVERVEISRRLVKASAGRLPIVASGNFGDTLEAQAHEMSRILDTGVDAVIILVSNLPDQTDLLTQILHLACLVDGPLGLYECPFPQHSLLTPEEVRQIAETGRFVFMKETSRDVETYRQKVQAAKGTPLRVFQANLRCSPKSLEVGGPGLCGIFCNLCPEWSASFCKSGGNGSEEASSLFRSLVAFHDVVLSHGYPSSGKYLLQRRGLPMTTASRRSLTRPFSPMDVAFLDHFLSEYDTVIPSVSPPKLSEILSQLGNPPLVD